MIKVAAMTENVEAQMLLWREFPKIVNKHFKPALVQAGDIAVSAIEPNIPTDTGRARSLFGVKVTGSGVPSYSGKGGIQAQVGFFGNPVPWYINVVEHGARPHDLTAGESNRSRGRYQKFMKRLSAGALSKGGTHILINGQWRTLHVHPGLKARNFVKAGTQAAQPAIDALMQGAVDAVAQELASRGHGGGA